MKLKIKDMILIGLFASLTTVGAFIRIPIGPAPISLQFIVTIFSAFLLGAKLGALSQVLYVILGLAGIPIFTNGGGISYVMNPSFGYLLGFIFATYIIGRIVENLKTISFIKLLFASFIGLLVVYFIGVPYLYFILKNIINKNIGFMDALNSGLIVFLPGDIMKCMIASMVGVKLIPTIKKING